MAVSAGTLRLASSSASAVRSRIADVDREMTRRYALAWRIHAKRIDAEFRRLAKVSTRGWPTLAEIQRSKAIVRELDALEKSLTDLTGRAGALLDDALPAVLSAAGDAQTAIVASQLPPAWRSSLDEALDPRYAARAQAAQRRARALLERIPRQVSRDVRREAVRTTAKTSVSAMVGAVVERIRQKFFSGLSRTLTVTGTEIMDAHRTGSVIGQQRHDDVLSGWIWVARLDSRICPACLALHGSFHKLDEPGPLGHARCRCIRVPKAKTWKELGFDLGFEDPPEPEDMVREAEKWFAGLGEREQRSIMGPSRLALLRDGEITWADLFVRRRNKGWRDSYGVRPVRDLRRG